MDYICATLGLFKLTSGHSYVSNLMEYQHVDSDIVPCLYTEIDGLLTEIIMCPSSLLQTSQYSKLEKADILEMTVRHLRGMQRSQLAGKLS